MGRLDVEECATGDDGADCGPLYGWVIVPVEHFAISKHVGNAGQCDAEDGGIAELLEVDGETARGIFMIRHGDEGDEDAEQQQAHHEVVYVLPFVLKGEPGSERGAQLSQYHEEQVDGGLCRAPFDVQLVPAFVGCGLVAGCNLVIRLDMPSILYEGEEVDHHQHHS